MFIQTEDTPNPATMKFLPGRDVLGEGAVDFRSQEDAKISPLAYRLFELDGVTGVFLGADFLSVTKADASDWAQLKTLVLAAIMDHFTAGLPVVESSSSTVDGTSGADDYEGDAAEVVEQVLELLNTRVRPAVAQDGGDIIFNRYDPEEGVVFLHLRGACAGCPSSTMTLKQGVENMMRHYIPEVTRVEAVL